MRLEERSRDLAEENLKKEITNCLKLLEVRERTLGDWVVTCIPPPFPSPPFSFLFLSLRWTPGV